MREITEIEMKYPGYFFPRRIEKGQDVIDIAYPLPEVGSIIRVNGEFMKILRILKSVNGVSTIHVMRGIRIVEIDS